jgi:anaerobic ribonucleoside-triphosphate reductase activating protein
VSAFRATGAAAQVLARARVARVVHGTRAEGPLLRTAVWVRGCSLRCPGCCNPELFAPAPSHEDPSIADFVPGCLSAAVAAAVEGITIVGGEPLEQLALTTALCREARTHGLGTLVFTGYEAAELDAIADLDALLAVVDTVVLGRFDAHRLEPATGRAFVGSTNQTLVHVTARYADEALWADGPVAELRLDGADLSLVGGPSLVAQLTRHVRRGLTGG